MAGLQISPAAEADLIDIGEYSLRAWGEAQTIRYLNRIEDCMERLAESPMLGRACDEIRPGLRRMEEGRHVIFYRQKNKGILVSRVLHQSMIPRDRM